MKKDAIKNYRYAIASGDCFDAWCSACIARVRQRQLSYLYLNNVTNLRQLTSHSATWCRITWGWYRDHRLLWRHFTLCIRGGRAMKCFRSQRGQPARWSLRKRSSSARLDQTTNRRVSSQRSETVRHLQNATGQLIQPQGRHTHRTPACLRVWNKNSFSAKSSVSYT